MSNSVFVVDGLRTPFVKAGKEFTDIHPRDLGTNNLREFLHKINSRGNEIEEVIFGNSFTLPDSPNIARIISLSSGLPLSVPATTIHKNCASSMESFFIASNKIKLKERESVIAGGVESMSYVPLLLSQTLSHKIQSFLLSKKMRQKYKTLFSIKKREIQLLSPLLEGLKDPFTGYSMGETAELIAREFSISRESQDAFAVLSHKKAAAAKDHLSEELFPYITPSQTVVKDQGVRATLSENKVKKMLGFFDKKYGSVTIANSCSTNDGSSLVLVMSKNKMESLGLTPLVEVLAYSSLGVDPKRMGLGPVYATAQVLQKTRLSLRDMDLIEINEAFAGQVLACLKALASINFCTEKLGLPSPIGEVDPEKLNVNGGSIAIGHPIAATGTRLILTLAKEMARRKVQFGLATLCVGGGQGSAIILKRAS